MSLIICTVKALILDDAMGSFHLGGVQVCFPLSLVSGLLCLLEKEDSRFCSALASYVRETFTQDSIEQGRACSASSGAADPLVPGFQGRNTWRSRRQHLLWSQHAAPLTFPASRSVGCPYTDVTVSLESLQRNYRGVECEE